MTTNKCFVTDGKLWLTCITRKFYVDIPHLPSTKQAIIQSEMLKDKVPVTWNFAAIIECTWVHFEICKAWLCLLSTNALHW